MRKKTISQTVKELSPADQDWLDVASLAQVEITSERATHPIEFALIPGRGPGWQAAQPGEQTVRLVFDQPLRLKRIFLLFYEEERARTQEFVLRWLPDHEECFREILRQQYHFSPPATSQEIEDYEVDLPEAKALELRMVPDLGGGDACAQLGQWRLA